MQSLLLSSLFVALLAMFSATETAPQPASAPTSQTTPIGGVTRKVDDKANHLVKQLQSMGRYKQSSARVFSRCPSGLNMRYTSTPHPDQEYGMEASADGYTYGTILNWDGCSAADICDFKIHEETLNMYVRTAAESNGGTAGDFMPAEVWLHQHRTANATM